ncbi:hypothetical protein H696_06330 [Fonticula alba]|uniref:Uncharacterized protein n=1 Tax=Fonticula alba TaxID=691883 RepID=A0A058YZ33_FONAL|nr:hypothetical protein H696_06330 [Fonticula alba]KCV67249.1 hypothetical protein H696_06330 [Fonticula alba]|eukprot:XP_009498347.1 hypothetical protein H696_06330 [Fonticula alba]
MSSPQTSSDSREPAEPAADIKLTLVMKESILQSTLKNSYLLSSHLTVYQVRIQLQRLIKNNLKKLKSKDPNDVIVPIDIDLNNPPYIFVNSFLPNDDMTVSQLFLVRAP